MMAETKHGSIRPPQDFVRNAVTTDSHIYQNGNANYEQFWAEQAHALEWFSPWTKVLNWNPPYAQWFVNGSLNASYNCLDRHVVSGLGSRVAYIWEGEPGDERTITYQQLLDEVSRAASALKELGVQRGERVLIYMGMVPELPISMLACARIGAPHAVVFGGFSSDALAERINEVEPKLVITCDGAWRRGEVIPLKPAVDSALHNAPSVEHVVVYQRTGNDVAMEPNRDLWWDSLMNHQGIECEPEHMDSEDILFLLHTSGTTAKPRSAIHTTGGYLTQVAFTHRNVFDLHDNDVYWCTADCGWITGHSYLVYGPLLNGATSVMYEGAPDFPDKDRIWSLVEKYKVTILYTVPTLIRAAMKWGTEYPAKHDLSTLRLLGSVGEPINPDVWQWYWEHIGGERCPIVDTWWQTETGAHIVAPLPGITTLKPGSATEPLPGIDVDILDDQGHCVGPNQAGNFVLTHPWPSMMRGIWKDPEQYEDIYWKKFPGYYLTLDAAKRDEDGYIWFLGRIDDVMKISGHRISTIEVESALLNHHAVAESAVVSIPDALTGEAICAFVVLRASASTSDNLETQLRQHVAEVISPIAKPKFVVIVADLPRTRSGKVMRRLLRDITSGKELGDTTTLADPGVVDRIRESFDAVTHESLKQ